MKSLAALNCIPGPASSTIVFCAHKLQWVASGPDVEMVSDQPPVNKPVTQQSNSHTPLAICSHTSPCISYELEAVFNLSASEQLGRSLYTLPRPHPSEEPHVYSPEYCL